MEFIELHKNCPGSLWTQEVFDIREVGGSTQSRASTHGLGRFQGLGAGGESLADCPQQFPAVCRIAALLARLKTGFRLAFRDDVGDEVVKQPLNPRAGGSRRAQQCFVP
jgi:hypothetical protein